MSSQTPTATQPGQKTCTSCPSFLKGAAVTKALGVNLNGPVCAIKMIPLIAPSQQSDAANKSLAATAASCTKYGIDVTIQPLAMDAEPPEFMVGMDPFHEAPADDQSEASCLSCKNYVPPTEVQGAFGWTQPMCRATGSIMLDNRLEKYAKRCGKWNRHTGVRAGGSLKNFSLWPQFLSTFGQRNYVAEYRLAVAKAMEPQKYETDMPVTADSRKSGIRAWRKLDDPDGFGAPVYLPIFDRNFFTDEEERALIPMMGDEEAPELYADHGQLIYGLAVMWMEMDETPALWGMGGTGKTEIGRHLAWLMGLPYHRININRTTQLDELMGTRLFENNETIFHYGRLAKAWIRPGVITIDEPNTGQDEVWQSLRSMLDNSRTLYLDISKGESRRRHADCFLKMAMNPAWDVRNRGVETIGDADMSRLMHLYVDMPPRELEIEIIQQRLARFDNWRMPDNLMNALMDTAKDLRDMDQSLHTTWGIRHQIKVARALKWFRPSVAYRRAVADALEPTQMENILTAVKSHFK